MMVDWISEGLCLWNNYWNYPQTVKLDGIPNVSYFSTHYLLYLVDPILTTCEKFEGCYQFAVFFIFKKKFIGYWSISFDIHVGKIIFWSHSFLLIVRSQLRIKEQLETGFRN